MRRYSEFSKTVKSGQGKPLQSGLPFMDFYYDLSQGIKFHQVLPEEAGRIDLVAYATLKDFRAWPVIKWMNSIRDPLTEITVGRSIAYPTVRITSQNYIPFTYR